jgi:hypothetical protein
MVSTKSDLERKVPCNCTEIPCVHNPELSEDIRVSVTLEGEKTKKGIVYLYLEKSKYRILEETNAHMKVQVL